VQILIAALLTVDEVDSQLLKLDFMGVQVPFRNILFPTDLSKSSECIAEHVVGVAKAAGVKVWLLSVVPRLEDWHGASEMYFGPFSDAAVAAFERDRKALESERLKMLQQFQAKHVTSVNAEMAVASGGVADAIVDFAREKNVGMIMMPTRALGRRRQFLLGSVTSKVLHDAPCPVWTSPHPRELNPFRPYRRIVLDLDYRYLSIPLLVRASEFAELLGASLMRLHRHSGCTQYRPPPCPRGQKGFDLYVGEAPWGLQGQGLHIRARRQSWRCHLGGSGGD
jgi:nucleotide-binding universal stress UspA family protein